MSETQAPKKRPFLKKLLVPLKKGEVKPEGDKAPDGFRHENEHEVQHRSLQMVINRLSGWQRNQWAKTGYAITELPRIAKMKHGQHKPVRKRA